MAKVASGFKNAVNDSIKALSRLLAPVLVLVILGSCGKVGTVEVVGTPTLTVTLDTAQLEKYFKPYCQQLLIAQGYPSPSPFQVTNCTDLMVANFVAQFEGQPIVPVSSPSPTN